MWVLMVEAGVAFFLLVFIVWWTMYAGRRPDYRPRPVRAERQPDDAAARDDDPPTT
jgi:hypothetical protein